MSQSRQRVLIVDDAGPVVVLCVNVLQALGYVVKGANRADAALELMRRERFDLLVLDYKMPGLSGFDVFREARTVQPDAAVVLVTGHATPEIMAEADRLGFNGILLKPFTSEELRATVEKVLARRG
ncbi:MAG TPA: response regulator [Candidatus Tectomicrobia bacterium]|nr:response regulator [Candidatus Tectomicrobia bacterium]